MRPVFNDLLTEMQRSIGYFTSIDRGAKIGRVIALGNAMKLPGLAKISLAEPRLSGGRGADSIAASSGDGRRRCAGVQGEPAQLCRLLRPGAARAGQGHAVDQFAAAGDRHRSADSRQEALGRGNGGGAVARLRDQFFGTLAGLELGLPG